MISSIILFLISAAVVLLCLSTVPVPELAPAIAILVILIAILLLYHKEFIASIKKNKVGFIGLFLVFYFISMLVARGLNMAIAYSANMVMAISPVLLFDFFEKRSRTFIGALLLVVTLVLVADAILGFQTIMLLGDRGLKDSVLKEREDAFLRNGFALVYSLVLVVPAYLVLLSKKDYYPRRFFPKLLLFIVIAILVAFFSLLVLRASFATALVLLIGFSILSLLPGRRNVLFVAIITGIVLLVGFLLSYDTIMDFLKQDESTERMLAPRVEEIHDVLTGQANRATDINARQNLSLSSLKTFVLNPIFGVTWESTSYEYEETVLGVGHHSEWFDMLARYGLFAFILLTFTIRGLKKVYKTPVQKIFIFEYVLLGFLNPVYNLFINYIVFCYIPLLFVFFQKSEMRIPSKQQILLLQQYNHYE